jgi:hypothetical protein
MPLELVALAVLHCSRPVVELLLRRRQAREVLARHLDLDGAIDLDLARVLLDWRAERSSDLRCVGRHAARCLERRADSALKAAREHHEIKREPGRLPLHFFYSVAD